MLWRPESEGRKKKRGTERDVGKNVLHGDVLRGENRLQRRSLGAAKARVSAARAFDGEAEGFVVPLEWRGRERGTAY